MEVNLLVEFSNIYHKMKRSKKHQNIVDDYSKQKSKHLENLASQMLKNDEKANQLKAYDIEGKWLNLF
jgi:hypothetical protein